MRGTAEFLSGLTATRGMEDDVDEARLQLRQALGHCAQDREELDRLRKMLQQVYSSASKSNNANYSSSVVKAASFEENMCP